jgi:hypothetical protein
MQWLADAVSTDNLSAATMFNQGRQMLKNTPFEAIVKTMSETASKLNPASVQDAVKPVQDNLKAWAELAQSQAREAQAVLVDTVESVKNVKSPQEALEVFKASAQAGMALFAKNLQEATSLSVGQFHSAVDAIEKKPSSARCVFSRCQKPQSRSNHCRKHTGRCH